MKENEEPFLAKEKILFFLPYFIFLAFLSMLYIANVYRVEKKLRQIDALKKEINALRWGYMSTKSQLMFQSKQSEIAVTALKQGIKEPIKPPFTIVVTDEH